VEAFDLEVLLGYTYTRPITLTPDYNYSPNPNRATTYLSTSYDTTNRILKYRSPHLVRADAHLSFARWFFGMSLRYQSQLDNFDKAFIEFEEIGIVSWGVGEWLAAHPRQPWVADLRAGVNLGAELRLSLVINNLFNSEYSLRPLNMEPPRLTQLMLTYERS
jgi:outer membrane receptor protein involved in Fe transport